MSSGSSNSTLRGDRVIAEGECHGVFTHAGFFEKAGNRLINKHEYIPETGVVRPATGLQDYKAGDRLTIKYVVPFATRSSFVGC